MGKFFWINFFALMFVTAAANAQVPTLQLPVYNGTGCPQGSVVAALSPGARAISLLFEKMSTDRIVQTGEMGLPANKDAGKTCNMQIPLIIPSGIRARISYTDFRSFIALPAGARSAIFSYVGTVVPDFGDKAPTNTYSFIREFHGPIDEDLFLRQDAFTTPGAAGWSGCGASMNIRVWLHASMTTDTLGSSIGNGLASFDSMDLDGNEGIEVGIETEACTMPPPPPSKPCSKKDKKKGKC